MKPASLAQRLRPHTTGFGLLAADAAPAAPTAGTGAASDSGQVIPYAGSGAQSCAVVGRLEADVVPLALAAVQGK